MGMSDCPKCWETPCVCGHEFQSWSPEGLRQQIEMLQGILEQKEPQKKTLEPLLSIVGSSMVLTVIDSRYSDGIVAFLSSSGESAEKIVDHFGGGDIDWEVVRFGLGKTDWYPIVYDTTVERAIAALTKKVNSFLGPKEELWFESVEFACRMVMSDAVYSMTAMPVGLEKSNLWLKEKIGLE